LLASSLALLGSASADAPSLESLVASFAAMPGLAARFHEEKQLSLLQAPLLSEGVLYFAPPDRLVRHVEKPAPSTLLLRGDELVLGTAADQHAIDLASQPAVRSFVDAFRLVLAGDLPRLRALYEIAFRRTDGGDGWQIQLAPRDERLAGAIRSIDVAGAGPALREVRVVQSNGDATTTRFSDVDRNRHFSAAELEALFRIAP
jgi:outer membrane lipoprotein-sorting protein